MKKFIKLLSILIVIILFNSGCQSSSNKSLIDIDYKTLNDKLANKDTFILEIVQTGCHNCSEFTPKFTSVLEEYKLTAYSLNLTDMGTDDHNEFLKDFSVDGTPTVIFFENGSEVSTMKRLEGNKNKSVIISKLKSNGYIKD